MASKLNINTRFKKNDSNVIDKTRPAADAFISEAESAKEQIKNTEAVTASVSKRKATMKITIAPELKDMLNDLAEKEFTSASGIITKALISYIKENYG